MKLWDAGEAEVWTVTEREGPQRRPEELLTPYDPARGAALLAAMPHSVFAPATGRLFHTYQSFVLRRHGRVTVIDTCVGDHKARPPHFAYPKHDWPAGLARTGIRAEEVQDVVCTHLHVDHVGWNTRLEGGRWVPTFPNATYWLPEADCDWWEGEARAGDDLAGRIWTDSIWPLVAAGRARLVPSDHDWGDGRRLRPAPGHTPGMVRLDVETEGPPLIFASDILHSPLQVREPGWSTVFCVDREAAARTRRAFLQEVADTGAVLFPEHFAFPVAGTVVRDGEGFAYRYLDGRLL